MPLGGRILNRGLSRAEASAAAYSRGLKSRPHGGMSRLSPWINQSGVSLFGTTIISTILIIVASITLLLLIHDREQTQAMIRYQHARDAATLGIELGIRHIDTLNDWSGLNGTLFDTAYLDSAYNVTGTDALPTQVTLISTGSILNNRVTITKTITQDMTAANDLVIDADNIVVEKLQTQGPDKIFELSGILLSNTSDHDITITDLRLVVDSTHNDVTTIGVFIDGTDVFDGSEDNRQLISIQDTSLSGFTTDTELTFTILEKLKKLTFSLFIHMSDGSITGVDLEL